MKTMTDASLRLMVYHATGIACRSVCENLEEMDVGWFIWLVSHEWSTGCANRP